MNTSRLRRIAAATVVTIATLLSLTGTVPLVPNNTGSASVGRTPEPSVPATPQDDNTGCAALSAQTLSTLIGAQVQPQQSSAPPPAASVCAYTLAEDQQFSGTLLIATWTGRQHYAPSAVGATQPLAGLGGEAMADIGRGVILVRSGDLVLLIHVISGAHTGRAAQIATAVVDALTGPKPTSAASPRA
ncbi:hypothetical protein [Micromonospora sp. 4G55]|uniref:hypothetical protein n=1 Tax=Micromonospora sp. 4G55 TaxID=2806102 RepID=UPI001A4186D3|nr:hypothetical protein [Micromonospora sp. 4G55]MBM0256059.1 hypothetical protein [Micromonospora sp. 4G55]